MAILYLERRGCEFFGGDYKESDIGNYRVTTPGEIIPGKDGKMYCVEFGVYDRYDYRKTHKITGKPLKHSKRELTMTCAMSLDTQYTDVNGMSWCNLELETEFYKNPRKYTAENILEFVNSISTEHYDSIVYVYSFTVEVEETANFTPRGLIYNYVKKYNKETYNHYDSIVIKLYTGDYKYNHYDIEHNKPGKATVTITLERIA